MCICICIYIYIYIYIHTHIMYIYIYTYTCINIYIYTVHTYIYTQYIYIYMYVYTHNILILIILHTSRLAFLVESPTALCRMKLREGCQGWSSGSWVESCKHWWVPRVLTHTHVVKRSQDQYFIDIISTALILKD